MIIHIHGIGDTIHSFKSDGNKIIGINDSARFFKPDYLILTDNPNSFTSERLDIITNTNCPLYSHVPAWSFLPNHIQTRTYEIRGDVSNLKALRPHLIFHISVTTAFPAIDLAYKLGATSIILWGVDLNTHPQLSQSLKIIDRHFRAMKQALNDDDVQLYIGDKRSYLSSFIPLWMSPSS